MATLTDETKWEGKMVDAGVEKYLAITDAIRYNKNQSYRPINDESATSYGTSLLKEYVMPFEDYIKAFVDESYAARGATNVAAQYIARCDAREVAYITATRITSRLCATTCSYVVSRTTDTSARF